MNHNHIRDNFIDKWITTILVSEDEKERKEHQSSGKLTASALGKPLQWQILKVMGVPQKEIDPYVLRKFQRGKDVENWLVDRIPAKRYTQHPVEYRGVVGFADIVVSSGNYDAKVGELPEEVKSVTNLKFKNIQKTGEADRSHILQACLYALGMEHSHFGIIYIASDDYRILNYVYKTSDYKAEVDRIIDRFDAQRATGKAPVFVAEEKWQENQMYQDYPEFSKLTQEEIDIKIKEYAN